MFAEIKKSLHEFGVDFDVYFHEDSLHQTGAVQHAVDRLRELGHLYEKDGALWLRSTAFGDDKDRPIIRSNGRPAYISADLAYYLNKRERGFDRVVIMLGADHHGYVGRMMAMCRAFGDEPGRNLEILIGQMVNLVRDEKPIKMSKRAGKIITLEDLVDAIGVDAARYALARYSTDSTIDLDLDLLGSPDQRQPGFLRSVRPCSAFLDPAQRRRARRRTRRSAILSCSITRRESALLGALGEFPRIVTTAAELREPHRVARYLENLAATFHKFYDDCRVLPMGDEEYDGPAPGPALVGGGDPGRHRERAGSARRDGAGADVAVASHEAGALHAVAGYRGPLWLREPADVNALVPMLWPRTVERAPTACCTWRESASTRSPNISGHRPMSSTRADFRSRARGVQTCLPRGVHRDRRRCGRVLRGQGVHERGVVRWIAAEGLGLDVCTGGELAVALRAGFPPERIGMHGNNKSEAEMDRALEAGVGRIVVDSARGDRPAGPAGQ